MDVGEVYLRIPEDMNGNGVWDTGSVVERRQPERVEMYVNSKDEQVINTKANWEIEVDADMNKIFAPITMEALIKRLDDAEEARLVKFFEDRRKRWAEQERQRSGGSSSSSRGGNSMNINSITNSMR